MNGPPRPRFSWSPPQWPAAWRWPNALERFRRSPAEGAGAGLNPSPPSPLLWALLAAVALHGLGLSYRFLSLQRRPQPAPAPIADDSPELLQFSRRQPLEEALQSVPASTLNLPLLSSLPPPPTSLPPTTLTPNPVARQRSGSATAGSLSRPRPALPAQARRIAVSRPRPAGGVGASKASGPGLSQGVAASALGWIQRLQGRGDATESKPTADFEPSAPPEPLRPEGEAAAAWRRLWKRAMAVPLAAMPQVLVNESIELRRLPLAAAALEAGSREAPTALVLDERLLLLWPEGSVLWLLRAPQRISSQPGDGMGPSATGVRPSR